MARSDKSDGPPLGRPPAEGLRESRYWERKPLAAMTDAEWEALCDGCGRCCVVLLLDDESEDVLETDVACRLFDPATRRCRDYSRRFALVRDCVELTPANAGALAWMPETCAYRRLARGEPLPAWHPLLTGDPGSVAQAGAGTPLTLVSEDAVAPDDLEDRVTGWRLTSRPVAGGGQTQE